MALDADGRFLGLRVDLIANMGAYISQYGPFIPYIGVTMSTGVYDIPALDVTVNGVYTNTCPVDAYRGAGRPEAAFLLEKLVDACARDLGIGRRRDPPAQFHQAGAVPLPHGDRPALRRRRVRRPHDARHGARRLGRLRRSGWSSRRRPAKSAASAWPPTSRPAPSRAPSRPSCELNGDGTVTLSIGTQTNGQGHATAYAQFVGGEARPRHRQDHRPPGRHRPAEGRRRHRRLALDPARRRLGRARRRGPRRARSSASPPTSWRPRPPTSSWSTARRASSAPTARSTLPTIAKAAEEPGRPRRASASSCRTNAPIRTAPISARSRSIRRPARPRSSATRSSTISA